MSRVCISVQRRHPTHPFSLQIATEAAIQEMVLPGMLAVFVPVGTGFLLGPKGLGGLLAGSLGTCFMLALTMANAGGAWDNAKKWCEKCASEGEIRDGALTYTFFGCKSESVFAAATKNGTDFTKVLRVGQAAPTTPEEVAALRDSLLQLYHDRHAGAVIGDTVGDPFKDTSGPALNGEPSRARACAPTSPVLAPLFRLLSILPVRSAVQDADHGGTDVGAGVQGPGHRG